MPIKYTFKPSAALLNMDHSKFERFAMGIAKGLAVKYSHVTWQADYSARCLECHIFGDAPTPVAVIVVHF